VAPAINWQYHYNSINNTLPTIDDKAFCKEAVVQAVAIAPSDLKLKKAQQLLDGVKAAAKEAAKEYVTGASLDTAKTAIDSVMFERPSSLNVIKENILALLDRKIKILEGTHDFADQRYSANDSFAIAAEIFPSLILEAKEGFRKTNGEVCDSIKPKFFIDNATGSRVQLSWQTTMYPQVGAGIMAHEIGHVVSFAVSRDNATIANYNNARTCSSTIHSSILGEITKDFDVKIYQEEDWADSFSVTTMKILNKTWPYAKNFACVATEADAKNYSGNFLDDRRFLDSHSTGLYRSIQVHVGLGKDLPKSCLDAVGDNSGKALVNSCAK
jgi:hypothetical protein